MRVYELASLALCDCGCGQRMCGNTTVRPGGKTYYNYYHVRSSTGFEHFKGYVVNALEAEELVNQLLTRPIRKDWQFRIADIVQNRAPAVAVSDNAAEKLSRAKELYIVGDMTKEEYMAFKKRLDPAPSVQVESVNMAVVLNILNTPAITWAGATPQQRLRRNKLLLKWVKIRDGRIIGYELTDVAKVVFEE